MSSKVYRKVYRGRRAPDGTALVEVMTVAPAGRRRGRPLLHGRRPGEHCHSDGFEWGYGGSGPSELARWLLIGATGRRSYRERPDVYQRFQAAVVCALDDAWELPAAAVLAGLARHEAREAPAAGGGPGATG